MSGEDIVGIPHPLPCEDMPRPERDIKYRALTRGPQLSYGPPSERQKEERRERIYDRRFLNGAESAPPARRRALFSGQWILDS